MDGVVLKICTFYQKMDQSKHLCLAIFVICCMLQRGASENLVEIEKVQATPGSDANEINFGTLRLAKGRSKNDIIVSGTVQVMKNLGDEEQVGYAIYKKNPVTTQFIPTPLMQNFSPLCKFLKTDNMFYPDIVAHSDLPPRETCPLPKGSYTIKDYTFQARGDLPAGDYKIATILTRHKKFLAGYEVYISVKSNK